MAQATFGGGCFWCLDAAFRRLRGVDEVLCGYSGGHLPAPDYAAVCRGDTGHAEVVRLTFDETQIDYRSLLAVFFALHDPTSKARQGHDIGPQYRSVIFWHDEAQKNQAQRMIAELAPHFPEPIVTELVPATDFWPAEAEHQNYQARHPQQPYCRLVIAPKLAMLERRFAELLTKQSPVASQTNIPST